MRTEAQVLELILKFAREDERVRVAVMNGSRVNPNIPRDIFQDYDVVYFVPDIRPFVHDLNLIEYFGDPMIFQLPDEMEDPSPAPGVHYAYLMQFTDGVRIDLGFHRLDDLEGALAADTLSLVLLDKDNRTSELPPPSDLGYLPKLPTEKQYDDCCNEFWWVNPYAAKGLWRGELIGPKFFLETVLREELLRMLHWYFGLKTDFNQSPGKLGRFFPAVLGEEMWERFQLTYTGYETEAVWQALFGMGDLFREIAREVGSRFGFVYPEEDDSRVSAFICKVKAMPPDARSFDP